MMPAPEVCSRRTRRLSSRNNKISEEPSRRAYSVDGVEHGRHSCTIRPRTGCPVRRSRLRWRRFWRPDRANISPDRMPFRRTAVPGFVHRAGEGRPAARTRRSRSRHLRPEHGRVVSRPPDGRAALFLVSLARRVDQHSAHRPMFSVQGMPGSVRSVQALSDDAQDSALRPGLPPKERARSTCPPRKVVSEPDPGGRRALRDDLGRSSHFKGEPGHDA